MTRVLTGSDVAALLSLDDCIAAVESAFRAHGEGALAPPGILSVHAERGAFHIKTAMFGRWFAAKTNANFPSNPSKHNLPTVQGVLLLFDADDGVPVAVMDSMEITVRRTAAATAVAAKHLARPATGTIEIYGCGRQGRVQLEALARVMPVRRVIAHDIDPRAVERLAAHFALVERGEPDVIVTCTTSRSPVLREARPGVFIAAVGADNPEKVEIDPDLMRRSTIVTDVTAQAMELGDLHHASGAVVHAELGEIVAGRKAGRRADDEVIIFDSTGAGFQDAAAAAVVYERARERGAGIDVVM